MALFKILRGDSTRIDKSTTPFHDGYAYLTPDDGGFYIDALVGSEEKRIRINPQLVASTYFSGVLLASAWSNNQQVIAVDGLGADQNGVIGLSQSITSEQLQAAQEAMIYVCGQGDGTLTVALRGETPACDIPVTVLLME